MVTLQTLYYCFGIIIPTISLLFNYGVFAYEIGEYHLESKRQQNAIPIIVILLLSKLFLISFVMFFIYHYTFDNEIFSNKVVTIKCLLWGLLITVDNFLLHKELRIVCKHVKIIDNFRKHIYIGFDKLFQRYKLVFYIKAILVALLVICFITSIFTNNISSITLLLALYVYYNFRLTTYARGLKRYAEKENNDNTK